MGRGKTSNSEGVHVHIRERVKGYEHKDKYQLDAAKYRDLSVLERSNIRKIVSKLDVSKSTMARFVKEEKIKPHTNAIKPLLTAANMIASFENITLCTHSQWYAKISHYAQCSAHR